MTWRVVFVALIALVGLAVSRSTHKCIGTTAKDRTCLFTDLCLSADGKAWEYFTDGEALDAADAALLAGDVAVLGAGPKAPMFRLKVVSAPKPGDKPTEDRTAALFCGSTTGSYSQWLLDDLFGLHWLVAHNQWDGTRIAKRSVDVVHACGRRSEMSTALQGLLTLTEPLTTAQLKGKCYARVAVGSAGKFLLSNPDAVTGDDIARFREALWAAAEATDGRKPGKALVVQRRSDRLITNAGAVYDAVGAVCAQAEFVFIENVPFGGQIQAHASASVLIAVHGGALANMVFMRSGAAVIEVFPYGYDSPKYRNLAAKLGIAYESWRPTDRSAAAFHEANLDRYGITGAAREAIVSAEKWDPATMPATAKAYWADQDVRVDLDAITQLAKKWGAAETEMNDK
jgi:hypothetical protein